MGAISNSLNYLWLAALAVLRPEEVADTHEATRKQAREM